MAITGTGTELDPYIVHDVDEMHTVLSGYNTYWYAQTEFWMKLDADIDAENITWPIMRDQYNSYLPVANIDLQGHTISNIKAVTNKSYEIFNCKKIENGTIENIELSITSPIFQEINFVNMKISAIITFDMSEYSGYYNCNYVFRSNNFDACIIDVDITFANSKTNYFEGSGVFWFFADNKTIQNCDINVTAHNVKLTKTTQCYDHIFHTNSTSGFTATVQNCRVTGSVDDSTVWLQGFIASAVIELIECVIEIDFSACTIPADASNGVLVEATADTTVINTDSLAAAGLNGKMSAGTGMIPCTASEIRNYDDLTAVSFPVTPTGETPPAGWSWLITNGYLPYLLNFDPPPSPSGLYIGDYNIQNMYVGDTAVSKVYRGNTKIL